MGKKKFYVVWEGKRRGVYDDWETCRRFVTGVKGARYKSFDTIQEARTAFKGNADQYITRKPGARRPAADPGDKPLSHALSVDAACKGNPGVMEYRGVWVKDGIEYFRMGPYPEGTVNIGEFLAIVHALAQLSKDNIDVPVYSDSITAIKWVRDKKANTKLVKSEINMKLFDLVSRAEKWLTSNTYPNEVLKWKTSVWGEIPADYGRK